MKRSIPFNYHQDLTIDDEHHHRSSTLYTPPLNPYYYSPPPPQLIPQHVNQLCQHPQQQLLQPLPQQVLLERTHYLAAAGYNGNRYCETLPIIPYNNNNYVGVGVPNSHDQPQQQGSTARVSFWKAFNTEVSDAKGGKEDEVKEKKRCLVYDSAVENSVLLQSQTTVATAGLSLGEFHVSNVSAPAATATLVGVDHQLVFSEKKQDSKKKKRIKRKVKEEVGLMNVFFKKMVKCVINQQEVLHNKFVEVIERMDREQAEREEAWRREESEIYEREAAAKEHDRVLASQRESSIISSIEKITGKRLVGFFREEEEEDGPMKIDDDIN